MGCGVGCRRSSDPTLLWLWRRPVTTAPIELPAWKPPYTAGEALEKAKRQNKQTNKTVKLDYGAEFFLPGNGILPSSGHCFHLLPQIWSKCSWAVSLPGTKLSAVLTWSHTLCTLTGFWKWPILVQYLFQILSPLTEREQLEIYFCVGYFRMKINQDRVLFS